MIQTMKNINSLQKKNDRQLKVVGHWDMYIMIMSP